MGDQAGAAVVGRVSIHLSTLFLCTTGAFLAGSLLSDFLGRSVRRVQRYMDSRGSNGGRCVRIHASREPNGLHVDDCAFEPTLTIHARTHARTQQAAHPPALWGLIDAGRARPTDR